MLINFKVALPLCRRVNNKYTLLYAQRKYSQRAATGVLPLLF